MQYVYADPSISWDEWDNNHSVSEDTRLLALREFIFRLADTWKSHEKITPAWVNKKLAKLGITERVDIENRYEIRADVTGTVTLTMYGATRADALEKLTERLDGTASATVFQVQATADPVFTSGPEDVDPDVDPDAPTTVDATLAMLREIIMLGHIAGPKYCDDGANEVLASFGLDPIPPRKSFTVTRPVQAVVTTTVQAYDEASAQRVASWRWENERAGFQMASGDPLADPTVAEV